MGAAPVAPIIEEAPQLSAAELEQVAKRLSALQKLLADNTAKAKYKIELIFGKARSDTNPTPGLLSFWENGSRLHGGGDAKIYLCPGRRLKRSNCQAPIPDSANSLGELVCASCGTIWKGDEVIGELLFNLSMRKWSEVLYNYFYALECSCDLYLKHAPNDIRSVSLDQAKRATWAGSKKLDKSRVTRARYIYRLNSILADTANGADPQRRFYFFLTT